MTTIAPTSAHVVVLENRRFTCLSPTLVRIEFAPDGLFDDRRTIMAAPEKAPLPFAAMTTDDGWDVLDTGRLQIRARDNAQACDRLNLELRWSDGRLMQFWRPGDRDYQNLGGTLRSLDRYAGDSCRLDGVHPATMESPDLSATHWASWLQCEVDPLYEPLHPNPPEHFNTGYWLGEARNARNDGRFLERTFNWYKDARKFCPGVLSASGYWLLNDSDTAVLDDDDFPVERRRPGYQDWYFFAYGTDYRQAMADLRLLAGAAPLPPFKALGIIFSRWPAFTAEEIEAMARDFRANGYPLSTLVMDMEWHKAGWGHWEFNPELIPDPARFFARCKELGLDVTFNDHPLDVRDDDIHFDAYCAAAGPGVEIRERAYEGNTLRMAKVDITDKRQNTAFRAVCHREILDLGLDYWWNDGSRGQLSGTSGQLVTNKTCYEESERDGRRGMLLARYGGLGSHRYGGFFTGDANSDYEVLRLQCEFNIRAGGVGLSLISHDIGGFALPESDVQTSPDGKPIIDPERYLRWLQFGVFGPMLRFHSAPGCGSRLPYDYEPLLGGACRHWLRVRHSLLPYLYTATYLHHTTGIPVVRGLFLADPRNPEAYRFDQYYFGPDLLVAPMLSAEGLRAVYLPAGLWWEFDTATCMAGGGEFTRAVALDEVPVYVRAGSILPRRDPDGAVHRAATEHLWLDSYPGADGTSLLYEDDGTTTRYRNGDGCLTRMALTQADGTFTIRVTTDGVPQVSTRRYTLTVPVQPVAATLDTGEALTWTAEGNRWRLEVPTRAADAPLTIRISTH
jgi:hypothetical protein